MNMKCFDLMLAEVFLTNSINYKPTLSENQTNCQCTASDCPSVMGSVFFNNYYKNMAIPVCWGMGGLQGPASRKTLTLYFTLQNV